MTTNTHVHKNRLDYVKELLMGKCGIPQGKCHGLGKKNKFSFGPQSRRNETSFADYKLRTKKFQINSSFTHHNINRGRNDNFRRHWVLGNLYKPKKKPWTERMCLPSLRQVSKGRILTEMKSSCIIL